MEEGEYNKDVLKAKELADHLTYTSKKFYMTHAKAGKKRKWRDITLWAYVAILWTFAKSNGFSLEETIEGLTRGWPHAPEAQTKKGERDG